MIFKIKKECQKGFKKEKKPSPEKEQSKLMHQEISAEMSSKIITIVENGGEFILSKEELIEEFGLNTYQISQLFRKIRKHDKVSVTRSYHIFLKPSS